MPLKTVRINREQIGKMNLGRELAEKAAAQVGKPSAHGPLQPVGIGVTREGDWTSNLKLAT